MKQENIKDVLDDVESETQRFLKRLSAARERFKEDKYAHQNSKESGALRRAALDLKNELTRITQSTGY